MRHTNTLCFPHLYWLTGEMYNNLCTCTILVCPTFNLKRQCFLGRVTALLPHFDSMTADQKLHTLLCPATTQLAKCVSKFLGIISDTRKEIDQGLQPEVLKLYMFNTKSSSIFTSNKDLNKTKRK